MTASDLSAVARPFKVQHQVAEMVYAEFYEQGDLERELGSAPGELYDRNNLNKLPKMQVGFIDFICAPVYNSLAKQFPDLAGIAEAVALNRKEWAAKAAETTDRGKPYRLSVAIKPKPTVSNPGNSTLLKRLGGPAVPRTSVGEGDKPAARCRRRRKAGGQAAAGATSATCVVS